MPERASMGPLARRITTGTALGVAVALLLLVHERTPPRWAGIVPWAVALGLSFLSAAEVSRMRHYRPLRLGLPLWTCTVLNAALVWWGRDGLWGVEGVGAGLLAAAVVSVCVAAVLRPSDALRCSAFSLWCTVPMFALVALDRQWGVRGLCVLILLSKVGDIFGYFVGRAIGRRNPFPKLSPGKTVAGCVASAGSAVLCGAGLGFLGALPNPAAGPFLGALAGLGINAAAQAGDLLESGVKRAGGVKDSGTLFGPAGGVLDVVDSLLLSLPVALAAWPVLFR